MTLDKINLLRTYTQLKDELANIVREKFYQPAPEIKVALEKHLTKYQSHDAISQFTVISTSSDDDLEINFCIGIAMPEWLDLDIRIEYDDGSRYSGYCYCPYVPHDFNPDTLIVRSPPPGTLTLNRAEPEKQVFEIAPPTANLVPHAEQPIQFEVKLEPKESQEAASIASKDRKLT
jgi:hypothetical protein